MGVCKEKQNALKPDGRQRTLPKVALLVRDWRVRTLIPVILIHVAAFSALFGYIYRQATRGVVNDYQQIATSLLNEIEAYFADSMKIHGSQEVQQIFLRQRRQTAAIALLDPTGRVRVASEPARFSQVALAPLVARSLKEETAWSGPQGEELWVTGVRKLGNLPECRRCHGQAGDTLGFVVMRQDIAAPLAAAKARVRKGFVAIAAAWVTLLILMSGLKTLVITRPLEQMQQSLKAATLGGTIPKYDLEAMAAELQKTVLQLLQKEQQNQNSVAASMARVEQLACLGEIAAGLTHEIKNPLAAVSAALETVIQDMEQGKGVQREILVQMLRELRRAHGTLDRLLTLARPAQPRRMRVDLAKLLCEMATLFEPRAQQRNIAFELRIPQPLPPWRLIPICFHKWWSTSSPTPSRPLLPTGQSRFLPRLSPKAMAWCL